jgi:starch synthase
MHIVFAASECVPFAKTGGLADVVGALPQALLKQGHKVTVHLPLYQTVRPHLGETLNVAIPSLTIPFSYYNRFVEIVDGGVRAGVQYYFVNCPELFDRKELYGTPLGDYPDNAERFALYCRAVIESSKILGVPDVFHVHDWQAALIPVYLKSVYATDPAFAKAATVLTIHNAAYQGAFPPTTTPDLLFPWSLFTMDKVEQFDRFNFLKGGIVFADMLTTVSRKYAEEIQTPEFGEQLDGVLTLRSAALRGVLNGVDYEKWNPDTDPKIAANYSRKNVGGKLACRKDLLTVFGLDKVEETTPLIGIVSRFATQKGFDLVEKIADELVERDLVLVALGSGDPALERFFREWAAQNPKKVAVKIGYDEALSHKIEAGADIFLMPSKYEPCGLNQIYSLKYGTVPVVRATGGLDDTIVEWDAEKVTGTGFKFSGPEPTELLEAVDRALAAFQDEQGWRELMWNGMGQDYSWGGPAKEYVAIYEEAARLRASAPESAKLSAGNPPSARLDPSAA